MSHRLWLSSILYCDRLDTAHQPPLPPGPKPANYKPTPTVAVDSSDVLLNQRTRGRSSVVVERTGLAAGVPPPPISPPPAGYVAKLGATSPAATRAATVWILI